MLFECFAVWSELQTRLLAYIEINEQQQYCIENKESKEKKKCHNKLHSNISLRKTRRRLLANFCIKLLKEKKNYVNN